MNLGRDAEDGVKMVLSVDVMVGVFGPFPVSREERGKSESKMLLTLCRGLDPLELTLPPESCFLFSMFLVFGGVEPPLRLRLEEMGVIARLSEGPSGTGSESPVRSKADEGGDSSEELLSSEDRLSDNVSKRKVDEEEDI